MLNKEKYAKEIVEMALNLTDIAVSNGKPVNCNEINCKDCDFYKKDPKDLSCFTSLVVWGNSEYKEEE